MQLARQRRLDAAVALSAAGDSDAAELRLRDLVSELGTSAGRLQAEAHRQLANVVLARADDETAVGLLETALRLCPAEENALRAWILRDLVWSAVRTAPVDDALHHGEQAVIAAERSGEPHALVQALAANEYARFMAGRTGPDSRLDEAIALERQIGSQRLGEGPRAVRAYALMVSFEVAAAKPLCHELLQAAVEQGDTEAEASALYYLARAETFAGRLDAAEEYVTRLREVVEQWGGYRDEANFADAALAALRGRAAEARRLVAEQLAVVSASLSTTRLTAVLGALSLSEGDPARAAAELRQCEQITLDRGLREPGAMRYRLDLVDALVGIGELKEAQEVQDRFETAARNQGRQWALAAAARTRALLLSAGGDADRAVQHAAQALEDIEALDSPLERARALLTQGTIARRAKLRGLAREALERAYGEFSGLGAALWAERAHAELRRLGGRTATATELTETERRVAELVATGVSNKAAAAALFVSVRAVEANLTRVYTKLGVRSRAELAARLTARRETTGT
jgi:DNA-binding CsgD family transcriptional regulator